MNVKTYFVRFATDDFMRVEIQTDKGVVVYFMVQYEFTDRNSETRVVMRYDNTHGFCHRDSYLKSERQEKIALNDSTNEEILTMALEDIQENWQEYKLQYLTNRLPKKRRRY